MRGTVRGCVARASAGAEDWRELVSREPPWWEARPTCAAALDSPPPEHAAAELRHWLRADYEQRRTQLRQV